MFAANMSDQTLHSLIAAISIAAIVINFWRTLIKIAAAGVIVLAVLGILALLSGAC
jgi:hypothetical protein